MAAAVARLRFDRERGWQVLGDAGRVLAESWSMAEIGRWARAAGYVLEREAEA